MRTLTESDIRSGMQFLLQKKCYYQNAFHFFTIEKNELSD